MPATTPALRRDGRPWLPLVVFGIGVLGWVGGVLAYGLWFATPEQLRVKDAAGDVVAEFDLPHPAPSVLPE